METRGGKPGAATSPETARASELFDQFVSASTFKSVLHANRQLCDLLRIKPSSVANYYPRLKAKLHSWRAASLWTKLDKRANHKCYNRGKACPNTRVLIIGAGPCGLRAAIEAQLLGAKVVMVEKRDRFSRNNVLHLWPMVIHDLRNLGAKKFFGKFCAGSIDHISIRQLQIILLKVALIFGVEVHENVGFESLIEPPEDQNHERIGWHARVSPSDHPVSQYEFDVLIGADGKRNTLIGFNRKEFRGKLAIAVTANFINRHSMEEARVPEISGVAFIFNQKFFQDMKEQTAIDLENIVYYKDDTHYFVMTAKKQSLLERGVIIQDYADTARLLSAENVDREALLEYARDAAEFATNCQLPRLDFAVNHYGQADVAMFDFTSMYAAENASRIVDRRGHKLLQGLVGDSLLEPFWPTGSGCARGFLSSFDAAWMIRSWASGKATPLQVLAERESIYRLLAQTTPENLSKDYNQYTLNPSSRYPNLNLHAVLPSQIKSLYDTDGKIEDVCVDALAMDLPRKRRKRESIIHPDALLNWCQKQVALSDKVKIQDFTASWKNGLALCTILHHYRPDLIDVSALDPENIAKNNQLAFDICEKELGISPIMTGQEMAECNIPDKLAMVSYISQVYESFRGEIPVVSHPKMSEERAVSPLKHSTPLSILNKVSSRLQGRRKYSIEKELSKEKDRGENVKKRSSFFTHKRRSRDKCSTLEKSQDIILTDYKNLSSDHKPRESINTRVRNLEEQMKKDAGLRCHLVEESSKPQHRDHLNIRLLQQQLQNNGCSSDAKKPREPKVGKLRKDEWNVKVIEEKMKQVQKIGHTSAEKPKIFHDIFADKLHQMNEKLKAEGSLTPEEEARYKKFDASLSKLKNRLTKGSLEAGEKGHNYTAAMTQHMTSIWEKKQKSDRIPHKPSNKTTVDAGRSGGSAGSTVCFFCQQRIYLMERSSAEGLFFHRSCFKCEYCGSTLRIGDYAFDRDAGGKFYCVSHFRMQKTDLRQQEMMKRKQAFLSCSMETQEKEKLYQILLDNTEKALSPSTKPHSPLLQEPTSKDQTPERVEYENTLIELSEDELLTSELEEEELTQKNFGALLDLATSEDDYSDLSTDSETDEEAFAEELERSLTADETRKLAETWNQKYSTDLLYGFSSSSSTSADDEGSDTEIGSDDTDQDVDSDAEYSIGHEDSTKQDTDGIRKITESPGVSEVQEAKEFSMEVPVIDLKSMNKVSEDESTTESDVSEEGSNEGSEDESGTEVDSESESEVTPPQPPPQIPTIVIFESPPQNTDLDQEWNDAHSQQIPLNLNSNETIVLSSDSSILETIAVVESLDYCDLGSKIMDQKVAGKSPDAVKSVMGLDSRVGEEISTQDNSDIGNIRDNHNENQDLDNLCLNDGNDVSPAINENLHDVKELSVDHPISNVIKQQESPIQVAINLESVEKEVMKLGTNVKISSKETTLNSITSENDEQLVFDLKQADEKATILETVKELDFTAVTKTDNDIGLSNKNVLLLKDSLDHHKSLDAPLAIGESSSDLSASSSEVDGITKDIACDVLKVANNSIHEEQNPEFVTISDDFSAFESENISGKLHKSDKILCSTPYSKQKRVSIIDIATPDTLEFTKQSAKIEEIDLCTPPPVNKFHIEKDSDTTNKNEVLPEATESCETKKYFGTKGLSLKDETEQITDKSEHKELNLSQINTVNENISESNITVPSMLNTYLSESSDNAPSFITDRKKTHVSSYDWDSDKSISFAPIYYQEESLEENDLLTNDKEICTLNQSKENSYNKKTEDTCSNDNKNSTPFLGNNKSETSNQPDIILSCMSQSLPSNSSSFMFEDSFPTTPNDIPNVLEQAKTETPQASSNSKNSVSNLSLESIPSSLKNIAKLTSANLPDSNSDSPSNNSLKYKGYSGCFAEKVRPKSLFCDEIYLRSLDIKLQTQPFSSLNKSNDNLDEYHKNEIKDSVRKQLFQENNKNTLLGCAQLSISTMGDQDKNVNPTSSHMQQVKQDNHGKVHTLGRHKPSRQSSVSFTTPDTFGDPVSPYSCNQASNENAFPTKMTPKCDLDISKLKQKREKRKSVHEDLQGLPFADEEKIVSPIDPLGSSDVFTVPKDADNSSAQTPTYKMPDLVDEERFLRMQSSVEQEKARQEARARARLKSDEELGLSPNNYRKKYRRQLSLNSINYDELCSDEFCDQDEELEEDTLSNICLTKHSGIEDTFSMLKSADHTFSKSRTAVVSTEDSTVSSQVTEQTVATETCDKLTKSVDSLDTVTPESVETSPPTSNPEKHSNFATSPESCINVSVSDSKSRRSASVEGSLDEEKSKNSGKKSIFSILNFGKGNISKEKTKHKTSKGSEKTLSASLPCDIGARATPKTKTFTALKLSKTKDKTLKFKAKSVPPLLDNSPTFPIETSALNIHQTVIPKYTVYRNPETSISAFPVHLPVSKFENGLAPKASEDSFSDEDDTQGSRAGNASSADKEREKKAQRIVEKVHKQQILKRLRTAQEIQRRLEELEIHQKELEQRGVQVERALRGEGMSSGKSEADLMQEWCTLVHTKNKLTREIQELLIRLKDLELEDRHSRLQQEITHRMAEGSRKNATQLIEERKILDEMLKIVDKRNELVTVLEQLRLREQEDEKTIISDVFTKGMKSTSRC